MSIVSTSISQMAVLFSFIVIGFLLVKLKVLAPDSSKVLAKLENNLFVPALVLGTFCNHFTVEKISSASKLFLISCVVTVVFAILAWVISRFFTKDDFVRKILTYGLAFSNFGFMGNAIVSALFPDFFMDYLIFTLPLWTLIYLWGVPYLLIPSEDGKQTLKSNLKSLINPMFVAMVIGIIIGLTSFTLPSWISSVVTVSGNCMSPVAMILTGITLCNVDFKKTFTNATIYAVSFIRLIVFPLAVIGILYLIPQQIRTDFLGDSLIVCLVCSLAMPLGLSPIVIPAAYGKDTSVAAEMTIVSHILSVATIPLIFTIMTNIVSI